MEDTETLPETDFDTAAAVARETVRREQLSDPLCIAVRTIVERERTATKSCLKRTHVTIDTSTEATVQLTEARRVQAIARECFVESNMLFHSTHSRQRLRWGRRNKATKPLLPSARQLVVPLSLRPAILSFFHGTSSIIGHQGVKRTWHLLSRRYFWPTAKKDLTHWVQSCPACAERKAHNRLQGIMKSISSNYPLECVGMDVVGPLPVSLAGNKYIVTFVDQFSRWPEAFAVKHIGAESVARCLAEFVCRHGVPERILTDQGSDFCSALFRSVCRRLDIKTSFTASYRPQQNGITERFHRGLGTALSFLVDKYHNTWDVFLDKVLFAHRVCPSAESELSPFNILYGRQPTLPLDALLSTPYEDSQIKQSADEYGIGLTRHLKMAYQMREEASRRTQEYNQSRVNQNRREVLFEVGTWVWVQFPSGLKPLRKKSQSGKLAPRALGPCKILEQLSETSYRLFNSQSKRELAKVHVAHMVPCRDWSGIVPDIRLLSKRELRRWARDPSFNPSIPLMPTSTPDGTPGPSVVSPIPPQPTKAVATLEVGTNFPGFPAPTPYDRLRRSHPESEHPTSSQNARPSPDETAADEDRGTAIPSLASLEGHSNMRGESALSSTSASGRQGAATTSGRDVSGRSTRANRGVRHALHAEATSGSGTDSEGSGGDTPDLR